VLAVAGMNRGVDIATLKEAMANKILPSGDVIKSPDFKVNSLLSQINMKCNNCK